MSKAPVKQYSWTFFFVYVLTPALFVFVVTTWVSLKNNEGINAVLIATRYAAEPSYAQLAGNTDRYIGEMVHIKGKIKLIVTHTEEENDLHVRMMGSDTGEVLVHSYQARVSAGDTVNIYAKVEGTATHRSSRGETAIVPELTAWLINIVD